MPPADCIPISETLFEISWPRHIVTISLFAPQKYSSRSRSTQPSMPPGSVNEYQLQLGRKRQVWFIPLVDECGVCR